jgi:hypothetical protein
MKGNIKNLAVLVIIGGIAMFVMASIASVDGHDWSNGIRGKWAVTGSNSCLSAPFGFNAFLMANPDPTCTASSCPPVYSAGSAQSWEGTYTFHGGGNGEVDVVAHDVMAIPGAGFLIHVTWRFNYTVSSDGKITFTMVKGSYIGQFLAGPATGAMVYLDTPDSWDGVISPDWNHMLVTSGAPSILYFSDPGGNYLPNGQQLICNGSFVLFRLQDEGH